MEFTGEFETHITIQPTQADSIAALEAWASDCGLKLLHIVLDRGKTRSQPMLTQRSNGTLNSELQTARLIGAALQRANFSVTRIKIEAAPSNQGIPQQGEEISQHSANRYFEHHIKLLLDPTAELQPLRQLAIEHKAHLSHNQLRLRNDGQQERFITQRCFNIGQIDARHQLQKLLAAIQTNLCHRPIKIEEEFVVYDSNLSIDDGWLESLQ
jgi:hypothetical protein